MTAADVLVSMIVCEVALIGVVVAGFHLVLWSIDFKFQLLATQIKILERSIRESGQRRNDVEEGDWWKEGRRPDWEDGE